MLQHHTTPHHYTHFDRHENDCTNQLLYSTSHSINSLLQQGRPTSHVPPLLSSALCSNDHKLSSFSGSNMSSSINYHLHQQHGYHGDVEQSQQQQQTLSADELQQLTAPTTPSLINDNDDSFSNSGDLNDTSSLVNLSRRLRTNLSLAKQRMMMGLKQSTEPSDIAIYTQLENITLNDLSAHSVDIIPSSKSKPSSAATSAAASAASTATAGTAVASTTSSKSPRMVTSTVISKTVGNGRNLFSHHGRYPIQSLQTHNKHRVHKKSPYNSNSSYMELQANPNGYVSVVLRKKSSSSSKDSFATLARSFSFNICDDDDDDSDLDSDIDSDHGAKGDENVQPPPPCYGDTRMNESWTTISPGAITMSTTSNAGPSTVIGFNSNDQSIGMDWNTSMMDRPSPTWMDDMEYAWQQQDNHFDENKPLGLEQLDENTIDSWLQRGGFGYGPLVAATDQELADLLDFD
ncbi:unnamed protein product [Absidia cylindrospora]